MIQDLTRADLLALVPDRYLADGYLDPAGQPRRELSQTYATAACTQLADAQLAPQELGFTLEAIRLLLPQHDENDPGERLHATVEEALVTVARAIQQANNEGLMQWLSACVGHVRTEQDIHAFIAHMEAVNRQYSLFASLQPSEPSLA